MNVRRSPAIRIVCLSVLLIAATVSSARAGAPFATDDPWPTDYRHWEVLGFSQGTTASGETSGTLAGLEINYGAAPNLQLHVIAPLAFDKLTGTGTKIGYGDTEFGAKYRFIDEDEGGWRPAVAIFPLVTVPTGDDARGLGSGHTDVFLPIWLGKTFGDWSTFGGGGYWINPGADNQNYWFVGWGVQNKVLDNLSLGGELFHQTADTVGGKSTTGFNLGGIYDFTDNYHLLFSAGRGIQHAASTNRFSYYVAFQWTF